ncbi:MAG: ethylbenzene dehydrogenase-related protein [Pseudomonadota bacterium]
MHRKTSPGKFPGFVFLTAVGITVLSSAPPGVNTATAQEPRILSAQTAGPAITVDGDLGEWNAVEGIIVPLIGRGGVDSVELKAAVRGDKIYVMALWDDTTESRLHKPYQWDEAAQAYRRTKQLEDRFAITLAMAGDFSESKLSGAEFTADVWHWKASRSDPAGVAHDKMWRVSRTAFPKAKEFRGDQGESVYVARPSDKGDRLYRPVKYTERAEEIMPRYEVNLSATGSIADVEAKSAWRNGRWHLELSRKLDTGNPDDAVIHKVGQIQIAVAAFNDVDGRYHSTSGKIILQTLAGMN